ncbi:MAG: exo-alpha-sialidase [Firmicutes bacterium]|nr:exo-alpha-sialidase [Bacillota bacterium]
MLKVPLKKALMVIGIVALSVTSAGCSPRGGTASRGHMPKTQTGSEKIYSTSFGSIRKVNVNKLAPLCQNASKPLVIPTYDGSGQANHPKVLYFADSWHNWKYWMSFTPYPYGNGRYENPSLVVSNNGINWVIPKGLRNPVIGVPADVKRGGHYSDPHLVMHGSTMELWYRYNPAGVKRRGPSRINRIYRMVSKDGIKWGKPELVIQSTTSGIYSPAILYDGNKYKMWYSSDDGKLHYTESTNAIKWSKPLTVNIAMPGYNIWHQDIIKDKGNYELVFSAYRRLRFLNQSLYYAESGDGIHFGAPTLIVAPSHGRAKLDNQLIYRSSIVDVNNNYLIYYSAMSTKRQWHIFRTTLPLHDLRPQVVLTSSKAEHKPI